MLIYRSSRISLWANGFRETSIDAWKDRFVSQTILHKDRNDKPEFDLDDALNDCDNRWPKEMLRNKFDKKIRAARCLDDFLKARRSENFFYKSYNGFSFFVFDLLRIFDCELLRDWCNRLVPRIFVNIDCWNSGKTFSNDELKTRKISNGRQPNFLLLFDDFTRFFMKI